MKPFSGDEKYFALVVFGDSIAYGAWDSEGGWVERLKRYVATKSIASELRYWGYVYNESVAGDTSGDVLNRLEHGLKGKVLAPEETILLLSIGINDAHTRIDGEYAVSLSEYEQNIATLLEMARPYATRIAFVGFPPVEDKRMNPTPWDENLSYTNERVRSFETSAQKLCAANDIPFISIHEQLHEQHLFDGLHPNDEGHKKIFQIVQAYLEARRWL